MPLASQPLLIVGASARAAAQSAVRAGYRVTAIDLFADDDLAACADVRRSQNYPHDLPQLAAACADGPWMYVGGLENHPAIVEQIGRARPLLGNGPAVLQRVRDPAALQEALRTGGLPSVPTLLDSSQTPRDGTWLRKPLRGSGGANITVACGEDAEEVRGATQLAKGFAFYRSTKGDRSGSARGGYYFQKLLPGASASAIFVGDGRRAVLLGASRQLVGPPWTGRPFQYAGSIGPLDVSAATRAQIARCGDVLAGEFQLHGLFGVDGILCGEAFYAVEVNPRYTASCEVVEAMLAARVNDANAIALHVAACTSGTLPALSCSRGDGCAFGKLIVYSRRQFVVDAALCAMIERENRAGRCHIADIPAIGAAMNVGGPVFTLLASGATAGDVHDELTALRAQIEQCFC
jgi:predicted ATP-grasp superfamily ATP-dependent carboligase